MRTLKLLLAALVLFSCQEEVFLPLGEHEPIPVIEAIWTDVGAVNQVKVSLSKGFYDLGPNPVITNAEVFVRNMRTGNRVNFRYSTTVGKYVPIVNFAGSPGESYELQVKIGTDIYRSEGIMLEPPKLDSIVYRFREETVFRDAGYYLTVFGDIPFDRDNNYRMRIVRNDTLLNGRNDYLLFDETFGTSILNRGFELRNFAFQKNDKVRLELFRLNRDAYDYLSQLVSLLFNDGGLFSPPPQNPTSNIRHVNGNKPVLGYFKVSPMLFETITIASD